MNRPFFLLCAKTQKYYNVYHKFICRNINGVRLWGHDAHYLRIENAEGYVLIAVYLFIYLFIYLYVCYSHNKKSFKPNRMKLVG